MWLWENVKIDKGICGHLPKSILAKIQFYPKSSENFFFYVIPAKPEKHDLFDYFRKVTALYLEVTHVLVQSFNWRYARKAMVQALPKAQAVWRWVSEGNKLTAWSMEAFCCRYWWWSRWRWRWLRRAYSQYSVSPELKPSGLYAMLRRCLLAEQDNCQLKRGPFLSLKICHATITLPPIRATTPTSWRSQSFWR